MGFLLRLDFLLDDADGVADLAVLKGAEESLEREEVKWSVRTGTEATFMDGPKEELTLELTCWKRLCPFSFVVEMRTAPGGL